MSELEKHFPKHEVMIVLGVIYPQFWTKNFVEAKTIFYFQTNVLKATCCVPCKLGEDGKVVPTLFFTHDLDLQSSHFKVTMMHNSKVVLQEESGLNPMTRLWCKFIANPILNHKLSKFMKLAKIDVVQVFGLVENEHTFNIMSFMKNMLWN
jgi:hypothetical protein